MKDMKIPWIKKPEDIKAAKDIVNLIMEYAIQKGFSAQKKEIILSGKIDCGRNDVIISVVKGKESVLEEFREQWNDYFEYHKFPFAARTQLNVM